MNMRTIISLSLFSTMGLLLFPATTLADGCTPIFGGGKTCQTSKVLTLNKEVKDPVSQTFVPTLSPNGPYFTPDQQITFRVSVKNISKTKLTNVTLTDTFPQQFTYVVGNGTYDTQKKTLTTKFATLAPDESKTYEIMGKVASASDLASLPQQTNCFVNQISSSIKGTTASTNTQYCVAKTIQPTATPTPLPTQSPSGKPVYPSKPTHQSPKTGAEALGLLALLTTGIVGILFRRKMSVSG